MAEKRFWHVFLGPGGAAGPRREKIFSRKKFFVGKIQMICAQKIFSRKDFWGKIQMICALKNIFHEKIFCGQNTNDLRPKKNFARKKFWGKIQMICALEIFFNEKNLLWRMEEARVGKS